MIVKRSGLHRGGIGNVNELHGQEIVKDSWSSQHNINLKVL